MSAKELENSLKEFVKKYKNELLEVGCTEFEYYEGKPKDKFQLVTLGSIVIGRKKFLIELWVDSCDPAGGERFCFSVDFVDKMESAEFLKYATNRNIPIYLFTSMSGCYKIDRFNTLIAEYTSENVRTNGNIIPKVALRLDDADIKELAAGKNNWGYISYYFDTNHDGAICAIKNFFENILPTLDENVLDSTTRKAVVDARIGHGKYKTDLLRKWDNACAVTGCKTKDVLIASHAKPWVKCKTAHERISSDNGLLLTANLDALFDKGLITFDENGKIKISKKVTKKDRELLGLSVEMKLRKKLNNEQKKYLKYHRDNVWRD